MVHHSRVSSDISLGSDDCKRPCLLYAGKGPTGEEYRKACVLQGEEMKRIGIDLDGVVADFIGAFHKTAQIVFPGLEWDLSKWSTWYAPTEIFGMSKEDEDAVWGEIRRTHDFWLSLQPLKGTSGLRYISPNAQEIFFITSRIPTVGASIQQQSCEFLREHFYISFPQVIVVEEPSAKIPLVKNLGLHAFIDDKDSTVKQMANAGINVYVNNQPWNQGELPGRRAVDLNDFLDKEGILNGGR